MSPPLEVLDHSLVKHIFLKLLFVRLLKIDFLSVDFQNFTFSGLYGVFPDPHVQLNFVIFGYLFDSLGSLSFTNRNC